MLLLAGGGMLAGAMNALAGGGSFVSLPVMIAAGVPPVAANASSTVALYPGGLASACTYFDGMRPVVGVSRRWLLLMTLLGGLLGALLLVFTSQSAFSAMLPWLLLFATLALAFGRQLGAALRRVVRIGPVTTLLLQFILGVYGGYFGGAVGLLMTATWGLLGEADLTRLNAPRTMLVSAANGIAVVVFVLAGTVVWPQTLAMLAGGVAGGYGGAVLGRRLPARAVRVTTLLATAAITAAFFYRAYA